MRRYTKARNAVDRLRDQQGLGDAQSIPAAQGPGPSLHPLPTTSSEPPAPYMRPLPQLRDRPLLDPPVPSAAGSVDYAARQRTQLDDLPKGGPDEPMLVYPAWESRLVNMRDFLTSVQVLTAGEGGVELPATFVLSSYQVPAGYTAILKEFRLFTDPVPAILNESNTLVTLLVDSAPVPNYTRMPLGPLMARPEKTFVIVSELRLLSVQIDCLAPIFGGEVPIDVLFTCMLYGNLRSRTGRSPNYEVAESPPVPRFVPQPSAVVPVAAPPPAAPAIKVPPFEIRLIPSFINGRRMLGPVKRRGEGWAPLTAAEWHEYAAYIDQLRTGAR